MDGNTRKWGPEVAENKRTPNIWLGHNKYLTDELMNKWFNKLGFYQSDALAEVFDL